MAHALLVSPRTLGVLLTATLVLGCNSEQKKVEPAPTKTDTPTTAAVDVPKAPEVTPPATVAAEVALAGGGKILALVNEGDVLGHFLIADGSALLKDVKTQLMIPHYAGFLEESALRSLVSMALEKRSNIAQAFDLAAPMGCALLDPNPDEPLVSCTFGYRGGAKTFVTDLGEQNKAADGAGHVAAYTVDGKTVFVDDVGTSHVAVTVGGETFGKTKAYLERNLIGRAGQIHGDVEIVGYVATLFERYRDVIDPFLDGLSNSGATPPASGNAAIDKAMAAFTSYQKSASRKNFERIGELGQLTVFFSVEPAGVMFGGAAFPKPGTRMAQEAAQFAGLRLDPALAGLAPSGSLLLAAFHSNPRIYELASASEMRKLLAEVWAPIAGRDAASIEASVVAFQAENAALYDGHAVFSIGNEAGAPLTISAASRLVAGKSGRDSWKAWSQAFTPASVLGAEFSQYVSWKFTPDAANIDGVPVDRWTLEPGPAVVKEMGSMPADAKAMIDKVLGGLFLHIDRAEVAGHALFTIAPKAEAKFMKRAMGAVQGKDNAGSQPGLTRALGRDPDAVGVMAIDVKQILNMVRNMANYGAKPGNLPNLGTDLGDFYATFRYGGDGTSSIEFVLSQQMIEQLKTMIPK